MEFIIKNRSLDIFFGLKPERPFRDGGEAQRMLTDEIIIPKDGRSFTVGDTVVFHLTDRTMYVGRQLDSKYKYEVGEYDSLSYKLTLKETSQADVSPDQITHSID